MKIMAGFSKLKTMMTGVSNCVEKNKSAGTQYTPGTHKLEKIKSKGGMEGGSL